MNLFDRENLDPTYKQALEYADAGDTKSLFELWERLKEEDFGMALMIQPLNERALMQELENRRKAREAAEQQQPPTP